MVQLERFLLMHLSVYKTVALFRDIIRVVGKRRHFEQDTPKFKS